MLSKGTLTSNMQLQTIRLAMSRYVAIKGAIDREMLGARSTAAKERRSSFKVGTSSFFANDRRQSAWMKTITKASGRFIRRSMNVQESISTEFEVIGCYTTGFYHPLKDAYEVLFPGLDQDTIMNVMAFFNHFTAKVITEAPDSVLNLQIKAFALRVPAARPREGS